MVVNRKAIPDEDISTPAVFSPERYKAAREGAVGYVREDRGRVRLTGGDRRSYLQGLLTNDVGTLATGEGCYAALLTPQGRMISDMRVHETGDAVLLVVPISVAPRVAAHLADFIFTEDAQVDDVTSSLAEMTVIGPRAAEVIDLALPPSGNRRVVAAGVEVLAAGNDELSVPAVDLFVENDRLPALLATLAAEGVAPVDEALFETLRIEAGTPRFGIDMDESTIPLEAGIEDRAISFSKGCYVGQEVIVRVMHRGGGRVARKLVGLAWPAGAGVPARGAQLLAGGRQVGAVTSAAFSPSLGHAIALGYVHRDFTAPGTPVDVAQGADSAVVVSLPFIGSDAR
jgi:tRNA-modifying protein YgfZ